MNHEVKQGKCLTCKQLKFNRDLTEKVGTGWFVCATGPKWEWLTVRYSCPRHVPVDEAKLTERIEWLDKRSIK